MQTTLCTDENERASGGHLEHDRVVSGEWAKRHGNRYEMLELSSKFDAFLGTPLKTSRLELLLTSVFHNLNKRLPTAQQIDTDKSISMLLSFLLGAYDRQKMTFTS